MFKQIDRKVFLYVILGTLLFTLYNNWQQEHTPVLAPQPVAESAKDDNNTVASPIAAVPIPATVPMLRDRGGDVDLINVTTDTFVATINLNSGNLLSLALPKYPEQQGGTEPTILFDAMTGSAQNFLMIGDKPFTGHFKTAKRVYQLADDQEQLVVTLNATNHKINCEKQFVFKKNSYQIDVKTKITNNSAHTISGSFIAELQQRKPAKTSGFFQASNYIGASISSAEKPYEKISFSKLSDLAHQQNGFIRNIHGGWAAMQQRYFLTAWIPASDVTYRYFGGEQSNLYQIGFAQDQLQIAPGESYTNQQTLYAGPEIMENLAQVAPGLDRTVDYGWFWLVAIGFFWILKQIYRVVGNWGVAIIGLTFLIKLLFYKLSESSFRSMARMREILPKLQQLKERYRDNRQQLQQATMELYQREKVNPFNFGGCLPMLIQIPFFFALYYVLISAVELRHAPFILWITDLSTKDPCYILPILMGGSMFLQQKMNPTASDPAQAKMLLIMPLVLTFCFMNSPAGLVLYWLMNNLLSIAQQWYFNRKFAKEQLQVKKKR